MFNFYVPPSSTPFTKQKADAALKKDGLTWHSPITEIIDTLQDALAIHNPVWCADTTFAMADTMAFKWSE